jgi:hypothetical protein
VEESERRMRQQVPQHEGGGGGASSLLGSLHQIKSNSRSKVSLEKTTRSSLS